MTPAEITVYADGAERARTDEAMSHAHMLAFVASSNGLPSGTSLADVEEAMSPAIANVRAYSAKEDRLRRHRRSGLLGIVEKVLGRRGDER